MIRMCAAHRGCVSHPIYLAWYWISGGAVHFHFEPPAQNICSLRLTPAPVCFTDLCELGYRTKVYAGVLHR